MDSYRAEKKAALRIVLPDTDAEIEPVPTTGGGRKAEPELDRLSNILKTFNDHFGTLFTDADRVAKRITNEIAPKVAADQSYQNARQNTPNTARIEHDRALARVMLSLLKDDTEIYKQFVQNESFKRFRSSVGKVCFLGKAEIRLNRFQFIDRLNLSLAAQEVQDNLVSI